MPQLKDASFPQGSYVHVLYPVPMLDSTPWDAVRRSCVSYDFPIIRLSGTYVLWFEYGSVIFLLLK